MFTIQILTYSKRAKIWQNWCFGQLYHSKNAKKTLSLSQFSLVTAFFEGTRVNIFHIPIPGHGDILRSNFQKQDQNCIFDGPN